MTTRSPSTPQPRGRIETALRSVVTLPPRGLPAAAATDLEPLPTAAAVLDAERRRLCADARLDVRGCLQRGHARRGARRKDLGAPRPAASLLVSSAVSAERPRRGRRLPGEHGGAAREEQGRRPGYRQPSHANRIIATFEPGQPHCAFDQGERAQSRLEGRCRCTSRASTRPRAGWW